MKDADARALLTELDHLHTPKKLLRAWESWSLLLSALPAAESLDPALGPATSHGSAIAPWLTPNPDTQGIWIASRHPNLPNELSLASTSPRSLSRLVLKGPNELSAGITALAGARAALEAGCGVGREAGGSRIGCRAG